MDPLSSCPENHDGIHVPAVRDGRDDARRLWLLWRVAILLLSLVLAEGLLLALVFSSVLPLAAPGLEQTAGEAEEATGPMSQCQADLHSMSLLLLTISRDHRCHLCPEGWRWSWGSCYFFSVGLEDDRNWNESMEFCEKHNASLAVIEDHREMKFIQVEMRTDQQMEFLWVGLTDHEVEGHWVWQNGKPHQDKSLSEVQWNSEHRDCADVREMGVCLQPAVMHMEPGCVRSLQNGAPQGLSFPLLGPVLPEEAQDGSKALLG